MTRTALPYSAPDLSALARSRERTLAMWVPWTRIDARRVYTEAEVDLCGDHATLPRELIDHRLMTRQSDCSEYRQLALEPGDEVRSLLQALRSPARETTHA